MNSTTAAKPKKTIPGTIDSSMRLLDYTAMAEILGLSGPESARKAIESIPELFRLKVSIGRRVRFRELDVRNYIDKLPTRGGEHAG